MSNSDQSAPKASTGILTSFVSSDARAPYIRALVECLAEEKMLVFAENSAEPVLCNDVSVVHAWERTTCDLARLIELLKESSVAMLHIDCGAALFSKVDLEEFVVLLVELGIQPVFHIASLEDFSKYSRLFSQSKGNVFVAEQSEDSANKHKNQEESEAEELPQAPAIGRSTLRILLQNRSTAYTHRGGDTVVMDRIAQGVRACGHTVEIDLEGRRNPKEYDLVHLCNFITKDWTEKLARQAHSAGVPYVVTTMYEDWPAFYNQMTGVFYGLKAYVDAGQPREKWADVIEAARSVDPSPHVDNTWTAHHAAALIPSGEYEARALRRDYPETAGIEIYHCGCEVDSYRDNGDLFVKETGISDFIFCVGRLECRKNQLMLLKALEESELPVVFAGGGFTYQPEYEEACRKFRRKGETIFLNRLEPKMLASAYAAARVHVLPSWFELPGLVSLEAAQYGVNVVVTDQGTARDYFGDYAYYCAPDDHESILNAVTAAYYAPTRRGLAEHVSQFTWENAARRNVEIYYQILEGQLETKPKTRQVAESTSTQGPVLTEGFQQSLKGASDQAEQASQSVVKIPEAVGLPQCENTDMGLAVDACEAGDAVLKEGQNEEARKCYEQALQIAPNFPRALRSIGVVELRNGNQEAAEQQFRAALRYDPQDSKSLLGLGSVKWEHGDKAHAFDLYLRAAEIDPDDVSCLLYLVNAGYELDRLADLEQALRRFLNNSPLNQAIQYCLAGCYFRQKKYARASGVVERMLQIDPNCERALELRKEIENSRAGEERGEAMKPSQEEGPVSVPLDADLSDPEVFERVFVKAKSVGARLRLLEESKKRKEYDRVISYSDKVLLDEQASKSETTLAQILKSEALGCTGETDLADVGFSKAVSDPTYGYRAFAGRGAIAASLGCWSEAKGLFEDALKANPDYDVAIAGLGICEEHTGNQEGAWEHYTKALSVNCENIQALLGVVNLGYALGRLSETEKMLVDYLDINPVDLSMLYTYAGCLYSLGRYSDAVEQCRKILLFEPEHSHANELLEKISSEQSQAVHA